MKYKCFWCNKKYVDLIKHTKNIHPKLTPRSYDYNKKIIINWVTMEEIRKYE